MIDYEKPTLIFIRGLPGSGKSTFSMALLLSISQGSNRIAERFEADMWFDQFNDGKFDSQYLRNAHEWCQFNTHNSIAQRRNVIVSNTSTTEAEVKTYQDIAKETGAYFVSLIVENRHGGNSIHNVPEATIEKMKNRFSVKL